GAAHAVAGEHVSMAASTGDAEARAVLDEFAGWVAAGIANLLALLDPGVVVLSGGLADVGELLLEPVRRQVADLVYGGDRRPEVPVVLATSGSAAGAIGAALIALDRHSDGGQA